MGRSGRNGRGESTLPRVVDAEKPGGKRRRTKYDTAVWSEVVRRVTQAGDAPQATDLGCAAHRWLRPGRR